MVLDGCIEDLGIALVAGGATGAGHTATAGDLAESGRLDISNINLRFSLADFLVLVMMVVHTAIYMISLLCHSLWLKLYQACASLC